MTTIEELKAYYKDLEIKVKEIEEIARSARGRASGVVTRNYVDGASPGSHPINTGPATTDRSETFDVDLPKGMFIKPPRVIVALNGIFARATSQKLNLQVDIVEGSITKEKFKVRVEAKEDSTTQKIVINWFAYAI